MCDLERGAWAGGGGTDFLVPLPLEGAPESRGALPLGKLRGVLLPIV